jgi:hypothetical protein
MYLIVILNPKKTKASVEERDIGYCDFQYNITIIFQMQYNTFAILYINCLQERVGEGVVLNREITIYHK